MMLRALPPLLAILLIGGNLSVSHARGEMPAYLSLQRAEAYPHNPQISQPHVVRAQPYPYGYFGAAPSRGKWSSHYGHYNVYTQWTRR